MNNAVLKKTIINVIGLAGVVALSGSLQATSFDCAKASTNIEKMICASPPVSNMDEQLAVAYKAALEKVADKDGLKQQQRTWLKETRNACKDSTCLFEVYQKRLIELRKLSASVGVSPQISHGSEATVKPTTTAVTIPEDKRIENQKLPLTFKLVEGDSYPICQPYVDMLNKTQYMEYPACERKLLPEFKQFKSIEWTEISDKKEIERILYDAYSLVDARYDRLKSPSHERGWNLKKEKIYSGKTRLYFYNFDFEEDGNSEVIYRETWLYNKGNKSHDCDVSSSYSVFDRKITINNVIKNPSDHYGNLSLSVSDQLFLFNNRVINSNWMPIKNHYRIELWGVGGYAALCKIRVE